MRSRPDDARRSDARSRFRHLRAERPAGAGVGPRFSSGAFRSRPRSAPRPKWRASPTTCRRGRGSFIACLPGQDLASVGDLAIRLAREGMTPVPHLPARSIPSEQALDDHLARLAGEAGTSDALVIGGGVDRPAGPFDRSMQLIESGLLDKHGIRRIGVAGHPEGNRDIGEAGIRQALAEKKRLRRAHRARPPHRHPVRVRRSVPDKVGQAADHPGQPAADPHRHRRAGDAEEPAALRHDVRHRPVDPGAQAPGAEHRPADSGVGARHPGSRPRPLSRHRPGLPDRQGPFLLPSAVSSGRRNGWSWQPPALSTWTARAVSGSTGSSSPDISRRKVHRGLKSARVLKVRTNTWPDVRKSPRCGTV